MPVVHGFEPVSERIIKELETTARLYRHRKTGTEMLSLVNTDENKVFGITFRTPPSDSTGVPHILEHSVLCGSRKYPVKEPFVELLKGSLQTFLNAFTYPDRTCYPVASQHETDFYHLVDVYLDAVFYPRLTPQLLQQEGWRIEAGAPDRPFRYQGVVYSEMKGMYSSPERALMEYSQQAVFPDSPYVHDSGGRPDVIPSLTFEQFKTFHETYYHPSNARIFFYGNDDPDRRLAVVDEYLRDFDHRVVHSEILLQPPFTKPRTIVRRVASGEGEGPQGLITLNWLLPEATNVEDNFALTMIDYMLLGMPASPLHKALIDSGLGRDVVGVGLESDLRQMYYSVGLKGMDPADGERVERLILETLERLVKEGIHPDTVEAAVNTVEFGLRENNTGQFPRGLVVMLRALTSWLYDADPLSMVAFEAPLNAVKEKARTQKNYFEEILKRYFLENPHRVRLVLEPDPEMSAQKDEEERIGLERLKASMKSDEVARVVEEARTLKRLQETPDPPEALATLPMLDLDDMPRKNRLIPAEQFTLEGCTVHAHDLPTNGIVYFDLGLDLKRVPQSHLPYVPLFARSLLEMGTAREDFVTFNQRISRKTGGIRRSFFTSTVKNTDDPTAWLMLRGKALAEETDELLDIIREALLTVKLDNPERFRQMLLESRARHEEKLLTSGHSVVVSRIKSHFDRAGWAAEQLHGVSQLQFLRGLADKVDNDWPGVLAVLRALQNVLVSRDALVVNMTVDGSRRPGVEKSLETFLRALPAEQAYTAQWTPGSLVRNEALTVPTQVNYVGKGTDVYAGGYRFHGSALVVLRHLRTGYLWQKVRVQGGAYGAFCSLDRMSGVLSFVSYRDPHLASTLKAFDEAADYLRTTDFGADELSKNIIGTIGEIDDYLLPDAKGYASLARRLSGDTEEERQVMREQVLSCGLKEFRDFVDPLCAVAEQGLVKVVASPEAVEKANLAGKGLTVTRML